LSDLFSSLVVFERLCLISASTRELS